MSDLSDASFTVVPAGDDDWPWMTDAYERTAWESLSPHQQRLVSRHDLRRQTRKQAEAFRAAEEHPFEAFVARDAAGRRAGFVWAEEGRHGFTGETRAYVLELYVSGAYRRRGVGKLLVQAVEAWGRERGLERIALNVAAHNTPARGLYESLGFETDTVRMSKSLVTPDEEP